MYLFDTYAILEIIKGNKAYEKFADITIKTSVFNLAELYYVLLSSYDKATADYWYGKFNFDLVQVTLETARKAAYFRFANRKRSLSLIDCIGYVLALEHGLKFLTGDKQFNGMKGVEFV